MASGSYSGSGPHVHPLGSGSGMKWDGAEWLVVPTWDPLVHIEANTLEHTVYVDTDHTSTKNSKCNSRVDFYIIL